MLLRNGNISPSMPATYSAILELVLNKLSNKNFVCCVWADLEVVAVLTRLHLWQEDTRVKVLIFSLLRGLRDIFIYLFIADTKSIV